MLFNSLHYLVFFPVVVAAYFRCPHRFRWALLLIASCYFYMAFIPKYILILFLVIAIDYMSAMFIERNQGAARTRWLGASILANLSLLALFKYFDFFAVSTERFLHAIGFAAHVSSLDLILPIGLSFHTFQSLAYTIEVYYGRFPAERHLGRFAVYVLFFPQMVAGPIERPRHLLPQLRVPQRFSYDNAVSGFRLILEGLAKKVLMADNLAVVVDQVYGAPRSFAGPALAFATICFAFQIYFDFSGYSDIARGSARMMGIELMENFRRPYLSQSIREFWTRWHISLSTWFRDYVYIPLGGNRVSPARHAFNLIAVFALSGLWHGASWTFVCWGLLHGTYAIAGLAWRRATGSPLLGAGPAGVLARTIGIFLICSVAWVFFRAASVSDAIYIVSHLADGWSGVRQLFAPLVVSGPIAATYAAIVATMILIELHQEGRWRMPRPAAADALRWAADGAVIFLIVLAGRLESQQFIYFQF